MAEKLKIEVNATMTNPPTPIGYLVIGGFTIIGELSEEQVAKAHQQFSAIKKIKEEAPK